YLDQMLRPGTLVVEPQQPSDRVGHIGDEHAIAVLRRLKQLVLLRLVGLAWLRLFLVAQSDEPIGFLPALWLIPEFALTVGVGARGGLPVCGFQLLHQTGGLADRDDELHPLLFIGLHGVPT